MNHVRFQVFIFWIHFHAKQVEIRIIIFTGEFNTF